MAGIIDKLKEELNALKQKINSGEITEKVRQQFVANYDKIEAAYNNLLIKGGLISAEDEIDATQVLVDAKRQELERSARRTKTIAAIILTASIATIVTLIVIKRKK